MKFFTRVLALLIANFQASASLHVCTVASHQTTTLAQLERSCTHYGIDLKVIGIGLPYKGNGQKLTHLYSYIKDLPEEDIVLFVDAYDCLILASADTIVDKFLQKDIPCVISAEACFCPKSHLYLIDRFQPSPTRFQYLNSGSIIGYAGYIKKLIEAISPVNESRSDQGQIMTYYVDHQDEILLDYYGDLFLTLQNVDGNELFIDRTSKTVTCLFTDTLPCVVHGNGDGKGMYQAIFDLFWGGKRI